MIPQVVVRKRFSVPCPLLQTISTNCKRCVTSHCGAVYRILSAQYAILQSRLELLNQLDGFDDRGDVKAEFSGTSFLRCYIVGT